MKHLIETDPHGIVNCGDRLIGFDGKSEFSVMADNTKESATPNMVSQ